MKFSLHIQLRCQEKADLLGWEEQEDLVKSVKSEQHNHSPLEKPLLVWSIGMECWK
jgi:hypothetical protein